MLCVKSLFTDTKRPVALLPRILSTRYNSYAF